MIFFISSPYLDLIQSPALERSWPAPLIAPPTVPQAVSNAATMATNTNIPFISVLSDQELENVILTQKSELVNHYPFGIVDQADYTLPSLYITPGEASIQKPSTPSSVVPKLFGIPWMWAKLSQISHSSRIGLSYGFQRGIIGACQDLF
jgi:hypothetical protein